MTNSIEPRMIAAFNTYATDCDPDDAYELIDADILDRTLTIARADTFDDIAILNLQLNDELHELTLIAIFDRDTLAIRAMTLHSDNTITPIPDTYFD